MRKSRIVIFMITCMLLAVGIVMIYSASAIFAYERYHDSCYFLKRHMLYLLIGFLGAVGVMSFDYRKLKVLARPLLLATILLLILVLMPGIGKEAGGARRWFKFFNMSFQPSEFAKLAIIVYLADFLSRKQNCIKDFFYGFLPSAIALGAVSIFVLLQPDLGTAISLASIGLTMYFASGIRMIYMLWAFLLSVPALYAMIFNVAYRRRRILAFLNPWLDPRGVGFQIVQSFIALGSGGLLGVGLGKSQQKLFYLPASHTDFIFSIIGEELGLIGALVVILLFVFFILNGARIAFKAQDLFGQFIALGVIAKISFEAAVNIGVSIGCLPTKGLPLPFVSYGGSALIFNMIAVGLLLNVGKARPNERV
ncbi:MAG: putative lipid II flippase FtsW [Candidatus Omnitrophica bacterium CG12_big_fil_rev_8_21_14_0_65_43_15]|uniref:Probable peptidoglycan glycosyltransferase FtsW n=1 Tax=Candidatus Taenaricola geysiri TaxID=1974752 RepID=A0A2J0LNF6_9BACT|nr:MAG: putative lipid II flippase FtsW [Candidatus Omnitrophica bacterium CG10_big_fil_rev_8_21_14_0_10_43_8]PIV12092.1 MAG: putative lipid II flippase FtsW [Candidatus Omnitrophica bacterium CG03_land_8_20_14_0_80_43_22]PIW66266.1 MAG: putative lipid II flippase FtsW [Candidatus Omnitrophica bacterium CG12_big_fil_rev_8_21_14_0_65_43_15]PIW79694.1 MAG: putative lipid II flippase FtsW [Candidatus Omnitrophica bacterium CG_4_8_14_3_um_filter_43_15]PIY84581.1 MAG: putative lipid II flippase FtsW